jgi:hypothetical protein
MTKLNTQAAHPNSHIPTAFCACGPFVTSNFNPEFAAPLATVEFSDAAVVDIFLAHWPKKVYNYNEKKNEFVVILKIPCNLQWQSNECYIALHNTFSKRSRNGLYR